MRATMIDVGGPVFVADFGGSGPVMILAHGLGGHHLNWMRAGPLLAGRYRVFGPDVAGFGLTPPAGRSASMHANAELLAGIVERLGTPAILVGNSMGGLLSILVAARRADLVAGLILVDPAVPRPPGAPVDGQVAMAFAAFMTPGVGDLVLRRRWARLGAEGIVRENFILCTADPDRIPPDVVKAHVELTKQRLEMPWSHLSYLEAARSLIRVVLRRRQFAEVLRRVHVPTLVVHGDTDRLVNVAASRELVRLRPDWTLRVLDDVGHVPHLEVPERLVSEIDTWLAGPGQEAVENAGSAEAVG